MNVATAPRNCALRIPQMFHTKSTPTYIGAYFYGPGTTEIDHVLIEKRILWPGYGSFRTVGRALGVPYNAQLGGDM